MPTPSMEIKEGGGRGKGESWRPSSSGDLEDDTLLPTISTALSNND